MDLGCTGVPRPIGACCRFFWALARGAASESTIRVRLLPAPKARAAELLDTDGYIFGTPENLASMAGLMKDFFDHTCYQALDHNISRRAYATLICVGSDGHNAARQVERLTTGWRFKAIADPLIVCTHARIPDAIMAPKVIDPDDLKRCEEIGAARSRNEHRGVLMDPEQGQSGPTFRVTRSRAGLTQD